MGKLGQAAMPIYRFVSEEDGERVLCITFSAPSQAEAVQVDSWRVPQEEVKR